MSRALARAKQTQSNIWAEKPQLKNAIFGSKLSFLGLHYIVLQYILIASSASPGKLHAESLFTPPLRVLGIFDCPALSFPALQLYGGCGVIPANATANHSCTILSPAQKQALNSVCWRKPGELSQRHAPWHAFHSLASVCAANHRPGPTPLPWLSSSRIKIVKPDLQVQLCPRWTGID